MNRDCLFTSYPRETGSENALNLNGYPVLGHTIILIGAKFPNFFRGLIAVFSLKILSFNLVGTAGDEEGGRGAVLPSDLQQQEEAGEGGELGRGGLQPGGDQEHKISGQGGQSSV